MMEKPLPDLSPDGLRIYVPWADFRLGESVFIPCINVARARGQVATAARYFDFTFEARTRIERGILGLRVWRTT